MMNAGWNGQERAANIVPIPPRVHRRPFRFAAALLAIVTAGSASDMAHAGSRTGVAPDFSPIAAQVEKWVASGVYPGAGILIGCGDRTLLERYFGTYNPGTVVHIASAGKWLAAATIASVVDSGQLRWDDPVSKWLPELDGAKGRATLRQLLSHTAGYPDYQPEDRPRDDYQTLAESVAHIVPLPADGEPGTHFRYGGLAMQVAGRMAEVATGKSWEILFQSRIARPLGMRDTAFTPVSAEPGFSPMLGGGARTTLRDFAHFLQMIDANGRFRGRRILSTAAIAEMQRDQVGKAQFSPRQFVEQVRADTRTSVYGLGEWREEVDAQGRPTLLGSAGWAGAYPWIDKTTHSYGFILAKVDVNRAQELGFSSFLSSPILPMLARNAFADAAAKHGDRGCSRNSNRGP